MAELLRLLRLLVLAPDALLQSFFNLADDLLSALVAFGALRVVAWYASCVRHLAL